MTWSRTLVIAYALIASHTAWAEASSAKEYPVAGVGSLAIEVDSRWLQLRPPEGPPGTIAFQLKEPMKLLILISPITVRRSIPQKDSDMLELVEGTARRVQQQSVEKTLEVRSIRGPQARGYQIHATDRAPGPGEYRFMYQGAVLLDSLPVTFTILYNQGAEEHAKRGLEAIRDLRLTRGA